MNSVHDEIGVRSWSVRASRPSLFTITIMAILFALIVSSWIYLASISANNRPIFSADSLSGAIDFVSLLAGNNSDSVPAFFTGARWLEAGRLASQTLAMSVLAAVIAGVVAFITIPFAASNLALRRGAGRTGSGPFRQNAGRWIGVAVFGLTRGLYMFTRSVPELLWALLVIFVISPGILAGAIALAIHNIGVLGRLGADVVEDIDPAPVAALRSSGAGVVQIYLFGVLPQVARQLLTFQFYRWEVIIRTTAVVGFVAASGLGYQLRLDFSFFRYTDIALLLIVYVLLVWSVDIISTIARRGAR